MHIHDHYSCGTKLKSVQLQTVLFRHHWVSLIASAACICACIDESRRQGKAEDKAKQERQCYKWPIISQADILRGRGEEIFPHVRCWAAKNIIWLARLYIGAQEPRLLIPSLHLQAPPLPLTLPSLVDAATNPASLLPCAQRLLHSYPGSVWSMAALTHAVDQGPLKTRYQTVLQHYGELLLSLSFNVFFFYLHVHVQSDCLVCLFDLPCFFLSSFSSLIKTCIYQ